MTVLQQLEAAAAFAPLHIPSALSVIRFAQEHFPGLPQVACFDTAFHADLPEVARVLPIPRELQSEGIQRYGFHGLSCESIVRQLGRRPAGSPDHRPSRQWRQRHRGQRRQIDRHQHGIDPERRGDHGHAQRRSRSRRSDLSDARKEIRRSHARRADRSSVRALWEFPAIGSDMRRLHEAAPSNADARLAIQMFCYSVRKQMAAMIAALDGVDLIVFTGGIGENDEEVRAAICAACPGSASASTAGSGPIAKRPFGDGSPLAGRRADRPSYVDVSLAC